MDIVLRTALSYVLKTVLKTVSKALMLAALVLNISSCTINNFDAKAWTRSSLNSAKMDLSFSNTLTKGSSRNVTTKAETKVSTKECVVLIHGLWRSSFAMRSIENFLIDQGFLIENISYPSTKGSIKSIAQSYVAPAIENCHKKSSTVHIVTHSMGGVVAQSYLQNNRLMPNSKIVMLSPPSKGSELARIYKDNSFVSYLAGDLAMTLHSDSGGIIQEHTSFPEPLGVIAGYRNWSLWPEYLLPTPNDGMVSIQSMITEGMDDLILINTGHAMMRYSQEVKLQILSFLRTGAFDHNNE